MAGRRFHERSSEAAQALPREAYVSREWFDREQAQLFGRYWSFAGMTSDVPEPGDYACLQAGPVPLFIVRGEDGEIRAFHNICRHRGTEMLEGRGNCAGGVRCPYHRWVYKLDGALHAVPQERRMFPDLRKQALGLRPASVGTFRGLVFVHPDPAPVEDFTDFLADLEERVGPHHPDRMVEVRTVYREIEANWKIVVENYIDAYHLFHLHEKSAAAFDHAKFEWDACGRHYLFYEPVRERFRGWHERYYGELDLQPVPGTDPDTFGGHFHMLFPNLGWTGTAFSWSTFFAVPLAPDRTLLESRTRYMELSDEDRERLSQGTADFRHTAEAGTRERPIRLEDCPVAPLESRSMMWEDMWVCEKLQHAMSSPSFSVGPLARDFESPLTYHQRNVLDFVS